MSKSVEVFDDDDFLEYFQGNRGQFCIIATSSCSKCHTLIKFIEQDEDKYNIGLYIFKDQQSIGGNILENLGITNVPITLSVKENKLDTLVGEYSLDNVYEWIEERI
jgi:hypothetical protein